MKYIFVFSICFLASVVSSDGYVGETFADDPKREGDWIVRRDERNAIDLLTMELTVTPKAEARPALKHKLIPDEFELRDGNAAIFYLKAMGFLEQNAAREQLSAATKNASKVSTEKGVALYEVPPWSWQEMSPKELPIEEVKQYLRLTSFQPRDLAEAARRRSFSLDRNVRQDENPAGILLPDIQSMRELARTQSLRCRVAIAEGRVEDAMAILGQQYAMAKHVGSDEFLVSNFVGAAVAGIASGDALHLLQLPSTPNLYWAFASLPNPIIDMRTSLAYERQFLFEQVKVLREVDEKPRHAGYWQDFIDRMLPQIRDLDIFGLSEARTDPEMIRAFVVATIAAGYPGAKRYLIEEVGLDRDKVEAYSTAQVFFLAVKRFYEKTRDEHFKWQSIPFGQAIANEHYKSLDAQLKIASEKVGWSSVPTTMFLAAIDLSRTSQQRVQQMIAFLQTVEAIRMYGAAHESKMPVSLENLSVPVPADPYTGKPLLYELKDDQAILTGHRLTGIQYRIALRFAKP